ncbi:TatD family hydrolase [Flavobacterium psychrophilum]|uniref:TatD family hydrolase n=1 Tax=Flavobacterium psychrophilum TaxID=96345 RepID=UPI000B7C3216|nr:TatD family hydrolase [Flavobacterium psychrophilum]EKT4498914.1 TatD family hydrolase [Flavobacterium psychrophilum]ELM3650351.1 TatD family hydrolase [Flavobacterium psychrophilum]ELM3671780.1 TatD family hydrolase [Flavobacterium psychrophilum]ELM3725849.1 TatD family hydrolase [Flavobacterium psychrophilum]ELY1991093.1 TatD family hydrolase [Flavobacterium psychrophilum]
MPLIDTHTHLYANEFDSDRDEMIKNAISRGVSRLFIPSIDASYTQKMYDLEAQYPKNIFLMMGLHPCYVKENYLEELQHVETQLAKRKFAAIGEIGIDLYWDKTTLNIQKKAFQYQIQLAKKYKLPINIHGRDAFDEIFEILELEKGDDLFGIFHCFSGNYEQALQAISYNMKLGIGGVVTFKNGKIDQFLHQINIENIVLETDSPYLAPAPFRGKRNESAHVALVAKKLSEIYNLPTEEIARITTKNALSIFRNC